MIVIREDCFSKYINHAGYIVRPLFPIRGLTHYVWRETGFHIGDKVRARCESHFNPIVAVGDNNGYERWYGIMSQKLHKVIMKSFDPMYHFTNHFNFISAHIGKICTIQDYEKELIPSIIRQDKIDYLLK